VIGLRSEILASEYAIYESVMKEIFQNIICGCLAQAGELLSEACVWLLGHVEELGEPLIPPLDFES
jgi:hypothetical protein